RTLRAYDALRDRRGLGEEGGRDLVDTEPAGAAKRECNARVWRKTRVAAKEDERKLGVVEGDLTDGRRRPASHVRGRVPGLAATPGRRCGVLFYVLRELALVVRLAPQHIECTVACDAVEPAAWVRWHTLKAPDVERLQRSVLRGFLGEVDAMGAKLTRERRDHLCRRVPEQVVRGPVVQNSSICRSSSVPHSRGGWWRLSATPPSWLSASSSQQPPITSLLATCGPSVTRTAPRSARTTRPSPSFTFSLVISLPWLRRRSLHSM